MDKQYGQDNNDQKEASLSERVVKGGFWIVFLRGLEKIFAIIKIIIVARLISPADFGLMGIAFMSFMGIKL